MKSKFYKIAVSVLAIILSLSVAGLIACNKDKGGEPGKVYTVSLDKSSLSLELYEEYGLKVQGNYEGEVIWTSDNTDIVTVNNGNVRAVNEGTATVTATVGAGEDAVSASCTVTVRITGTPELTVNYDKITLDKGQSITLTAGIFINGTDVGAIYEFYTDSDIISTENVSNGRLYVQGLSYGEATVSVSTEYRGMDYFRDITVTVAETITLNWETEGIVSQNGKYALTIDRINHSASPVRYNSVELSIGVFGSEGRIENAEIEWETSNASVISLEGNVATVAGLGTATVTGKYVSPGALLYEKSVDITVNVNDAVSVNAGLCAVDKQLVIDSTPIAKAYDVTDYSKIYDAASGVWTKTGSMEVYAESEGGEQLYLAETVIADIIISDKETFVEFVDELRNNASVIYEGKYIALSEDMDMTDYASWKDLNQSASVGFAGTFDGMGHTVYGGSYGQCGMFKGITAAGTVKNLNIVAPVIKFGYSGVLAGTVGGTVDNVTFVINAANSVSLSTMTSMPESCIVAYKLTEGGVIRNTDVYIYDIANDKGAEFWFVRSSNKGVYGGNNVYAVNGWLNSSVTSGHTGNTLAARPIEGNTEIAVNADDGVKVFLVNGFGVKTDTGLTVSGGKVVIDASSLDTDLFGEGTFFLETEGADGNIYIPLTLA